MSTRGSDFISKVPATIGTMQADPNSLSSMGQRHEKSDSFGGLEVHFHVVARVSRSRADHDDFDDLTSDDPNYRT
jgi:hypothetical protein